MLHEESDQRARFAKDLAADHAKIFGFIHSLVRDIDDADDLFQQTSLILWRKFAEFDRSRSFFAWACGIARLETSNFLRSRSRSKIYFSDELNLLLLEAHEKMTEDELEDRRCALSSCIEKLRQRDRKLVEECYAGAGGVSAVAARQARSPQSVHNSLRRIRRALYECIHRSLAQGASS